MRKTTSVLWPVLVGGITLALPYFSEAAQTSSKPWLETPRLQPVFRAHPKYTKVACPGCGKKDSSLLAKFGKVPNQHLDLQCRWCSLQFGVTKAEAKQGKLADAASPPVASPVPAPLPIHRRIIKLPTAIISP